MNLIGYLGVGLSLLISIVSVVVVISNLRSNVDTLNKQEDRMTDKIDAAVKDLTDLLVVVKSFISEQAVVNKTVAKTLEGVVERCETCRDFTGHQDGLAKLLVEVLKHKRIVNIE